VGIIASSSFTIDREFTLQPGESARWGLHGPLRRHLGLRRAAALLHHRQMAVLKGDRRIGHAVPEAQLLPDERPAHHHPGGAEPAHEDLYITLMAFEQTAESITIRVLVEPLVGWIWVGGWSSAPARWWRSVPGPGRRSEAAAAGKPGRPRRKRGPGGGGGVSWKRAGIAMVAMIPLLIMLFAFGLTAGRPALIPSPLVDQPAPDFALPVMASTGPTADGSED
jgi:hypothetical protein